MTGPGQPASNGLQKARQRLLRLGLTDDHILCIPKPASAIFDASNLDPLRADPHFSAVVQRVVRFLRGGRGLSIAVADDGQRGDARVHTAVQLAAGLTRHGIHVVVVDMDLQHPGLNGLVPDTHSEGLIDMVRFGRSCRSVLQKPLNEGPSLLAAGSFPVQEPLPLDEDSIRSVLHRVSLHCELALYVAPLLPDGKELNPAVRLCEHVVLVQSVSESSADVVERIQLMQQARLHVAGVVLFEGSAASETEAVPWQPGSLYDGSSTPTSAAAATATGAALPADDAGAPTAPPAAPPTALPPVAQPQESAAEPALGSGSGSGVSPKAPSETAIPHIAWTGRKPQPLTDDAAADTDIPEIHLPGEADQGGPFSSQPQPFESTQPDMGLTDDVVARQESQEDVTGAEVIERLWSEPQESEATSSTAQASPPSEGQYAEGAGDFDTHAQGAEAFTRDDSERLDLGAPGFGPPEYEDPETEFAYDDGSNWSRTPLYILVTLLVLTGGFFGWALWTKRGIEQQVGEQLADTNWIDEPQSPAGSQLPDDAAAMPSDDAALPADGLKGVGGADDKDNSPVQQSPPTEPAQKPTRNDRGTPAKQGAKDPGATPTKPADARQSGATEEMAPIKVPAKDTPLRPPSKRPPTPAASGAGSDKRPPATTTPGTTGDAVFTVHVGSFRHLEQAYLDIATLQKGGFTGRAVKTDLGEKGIWYRVYVGGFPTRSEAEKARDGILELPEYRYAQVRRLP